VGISVHQHYCKDELKNIAFWHSAESCHAGKNICPASGKVCMMHADAKQKKDCCNDRVSFEQADWDFVPQISEVVSEQDFVSILPQSSSEGSIDNIAFQRSFHKYRPPPLITTPLRILFSTFLC
jgi:hypothetical protein